jgi:hypothetical protein
VQQSVPIEALPGPGDLPVTERPDATNS